MNVHDHFDGSAHCLECKGHCQLIGDELYLTHTVRNVMEFFALHKKQWFPPQIEESLGRLIGSARVIQLRNRANASLKDFVR